MEKVIRYRSNDGIDFETEKECIEHEDSRAQMINVANFLKKSCKKFSCDDYKCKGCPFDVNNLCKLYHEYPFEWNVEGV